MVWYCPRCGYTDIKFRGKFLLEVRSNGTKVSDKLFRCNICDLKFSVIDDGLSLNEAWRSHVES